MGLTNTNVLYCIYVSGYKVWANLQKYQTLVMQKLVTGSPLMSHLFVHGFLAKGPPLCPICSYTMAQNKCPTFSYTMVYEQRVPPYVSLARTQ